MCEANLEEIEITGGTVGEEETEEDPEKAEGDE